MMMSSHRKRSPTPDQQPITTVLTNRVGRKYVIMGIGPLSFVGWIIVLFYKAMFPLILVRLIHGFAVSVAFAVTPIYTAEIAEPKLRGRLSGIFQVVRYLAALYNFCFGSYLSFNSYVYVCLPLPIISTIMMMFLPETPYYLLMSGKEEEARKVLACFRDGDFDNELEDMKKAIEKETSTKSSWKILFTDKVQRKAFLIVQIVCFTSYLSGMTVIVNYATDLFSKSESFLSPSAMSVLLAVLLCLFNAISAVMSDWIGRKPLLLLSCFGAFVCHFLSGAYYYIHEKTSIDSSNYIWALYIGLSAFCFLSEIGLGPLLQTLQAEMFGASTRGVVGGITECIGSFLCFAVLKVYIPVSEEFGIYVTFWFFSSIALMGGVLLLCFLPETKGKVIGKTEIKTRTILMTKLM